MADRPRFLVTAGSTREMIDHVRDWGNVFTGNTGYRIARALAAVGEVDLLTSNESHLAELERHSHGVRATGFRTYTHLAGRLNELMTTRRYDGIFMTAAVSDYAPAGVYELLDRKTGEDGVEVWRVRPASDPKVKGSYDRIAVQGRRTAKLVDRFRPEWHHPGLLVKFKLEVAISSDELLRIGQDSRRASGADYLVANTLEMVDGERAGAFLLSDGAQEWVPRADLPQRLARLAGEWVAGHPNH